MANRHTQHPSGPEVLLIGTQELEVCRLVPRRLADWACVHICQPWRPLQCPCGKLHQTDDPSDVVIVAGQGPVDPVPAAGVLGLAIAPSSIKDGPVGRPTVTPGPTGVRDFGAFTAGVVEHILSPILIPGLIGISAMDVVAVFEGQSTLRFSTTTIDPKNETSTLGLTSLLPGRDQVLPTPSILLGVTIGLHGNLYDVEELANVVLSERAGDEVTIYGSIDERMARGKARVDVLASASP